MLIGSRAMHFWEGWESKESTDYDIIGYPGDYPYLEENFRVEYHDPLFMNNRDIPTLFDVGASINGLPVCSPVGLYLIKRSHCWRAQGFGKNITHLHKHLIPLVEGLVVGRDEIDFYQERVTMTKKEFKQGNPNLAQSNEDFFDDEVTKEFDHDYIHELVAYYSKPLYTRLKKEGQEGLAWCEWDLWKALDYEERNQCVSEECMVIAIERFLLKDSSSPRFAYMKALEKVCTTLCSGWFRDHAIDHFPDVLNLYDEERILNTIRKLQQEKGAKL